MADDKNIQFSKELEIAKKAVLKAGKIVMEYYGKKVSIKEKDDKSFVTEVDLKSEKIILDILTTEFPNYAFFSEEKGEKTSDSEYCWYIDPIDGTHNFMHGLDIFCISIGLAKNNEYIMGAVYVPVKNELYYAEKGKGAYCNGEKIYASTFPLKKSMYIHGSPSGDMKVVNDKIYPFIKDKVGSVRMNGATANTLLFLAKGNIDCHIDHKTNCYDYAGALPIALEAGVICTNLNNEKITSKEKSSSLLCGNKECHNALYKMLKEHNLTEL